MTYQVGDWVKAPGTRKLPWVYGMVQSVRGQRILVDRGYLPRQWYDPQQLSPATEEQTPQEVEEIRDALHKLIKCELVVKNYYKCLDHERREQPAAFNLAEAEREDRQAEGHLSEAKKLRERAAKEG